MTAAVSSVSASAYKSIRAVCQVLKVPRSTLYAQASKGKGPRAESTRRLDAHITASFAKARGRYGSPRIHQVLRREGLRVARKRIETRMRVLGLQARRSRRFRKTTQADPTKTPAPNLLARNFSRDLPDEAWVGDITYLSTETGWVYLALLIDLCTRGIVGWAVGRNCDTPLALAALESAVANRPPPRGLVHHTDRGSTYTAHDYQKRLSQLGMAVSMSRKGNCWDNAVAESTIGTIKTELFDGEVLTDIYQVREMLFSYIEVFYNRQRLHSTLGYISPAEKERLIIMSAA